MNSNSFTGVRSPAPTDRIDAVNLYRTFLGRDPESDTAISTNSNLDFSEAARGILSSAEFRARVLDPALQGRHFIGALFEEPPSDDLLAWVIERFELETSTLSALRNNRRGWSGLFKSIFGDASFDRSVWRESASYHPEAVAAFSRMERSAHMRGSLEEMTATAIQGWAANLSKPDAPVDVEILLDGQILGTATTNRFRRDLQDHLGGSGYFGFSLPIDSDWTFPAKGQVSLQERGSGVQISAATWPDLAAERSTLQQLRAEIAGLREALRRVEAAVPAVRSPYLYPTDRYSAYADAFYGPAASGTDPIQKGPTEPVLSNGAGPPTTLVVDLAGVDPKRAMAAAASFLPSNVALAELVFLFGTESEASDAIIKDCARRAGWQTGCAVRLVVGGDRAGSRWHAALASAATADAIILDGEDVLAAGAPGLLRAGMRQGTTTSLVHADADHFRVDAPDRRSHPVMFGDFDADLVLQMPILRGAALVKIDAVRDLGPLAATTKAAALSELALALHFRGHGIGHVSRVLTSRSEPPGRSPDEWQDVVATHLDDWMPGSTVSPHREPFVRIDGAVDIRRSAALEGASADVVILTRDQPKLLGDLLADLERTRGDNRVAMSVTIVDHGSVNAETIDVLARAQAGGARVIPYDGPFNWALMNNLAVDACASDVLVFLNDDMRVIAPDWLDRLCELALRPDVGAVGTRLHYEDESVQHAGIVLRWPDATPIHDGVGARADDPGYGHRYSLVHQVMATTGACLATRRSIFCGAGGFDGAEYPVEGNDVDYCLRLIDRGLKILYTPYASLHHLESMSRGFSRSGEKLARSERAMASLHQRWGRRFPTDPFFNPHFDRQGRPFRSLRPLPETSV